MHYGRPAVCRVPRTHGKGRITHGEVFAVGSTRQTTDGNLVWRSKGCLPYVRCRAHIKHFVVCQKLDHDKIKQQTVPTSNDVVRGQWRRTACGSRFAVCPMLAHGKGWSVGQGTAVVGPVPILIAISVLLFYVFTILIQDLDSTIYFSTLPVCLTV